MNGNFNIFGSAMFTVLSNERVSAIISFLRVLVFVVISVLLLEPPGLNGVWVVIVLVELLNLAVMLYYTRNSGEYTAMPDKACMRQRDCTVLPLDGRSYSCYNRFINEPPAVSKGQGRKTDRNRWEDRTWLRHSCTYTWQGRSLRIYLYLTKASIILEASLLTASM